jgi:imidazolonepropionase-like amidohydrolase
MKAPLLPLLCFALTTSVLAQTNPNTGIKDERHGSFAFTNATIHINSTTTLTNATLLIKDEKIADCGEKISIPKEAKTIDCTGKHMYASFIETWSDYGLTEDKTEKRGAYYWNDAIKSDFLAYQFYSRHKEGAERLRKFGIGTVLTHRMDGIIRGSGTLVTIADIKDEKNLLIENAALFASLDKGSSTEEYPGSLTGTLALLRQFFYDVQWYTAMNGKAEKNISLEAYNHLKSVPIIFNVQNRTDILRLEKIAKEFGLSFSYMGNGDEFDRIPQLKNLTSNIIIPLQFPKPYILNDPHDADMVSLEDLYRWDIAPANLTLLDSNALSFSISTSSNDGASDFFKCLKKSIQYGLKKEKALYALTEGPAKLLKIDAQLGTLDKGKLANFIITDGELGGDGFVLLENWVQGNQYIIEKGVEGIDIRGNYAIQTGYNAMNGKTLVINGKMAYPAANYVINDTTKISVDLSFEKTFVTASFFSKDLGGFIRISAQVEKNKNWKGIVEDPKGEKFSFAAMYSLPAKEEEKKKEKTAVSYSEVRYPNKAFGWKWADLKAAENKTYLVKNVTVWTNEKEGIVQNTDVITEGGKIKKIGKNLSCSNCITIEGNGMHLTSGIIDEHSHIAMTRGVNEGGQSSSAEVRMGDVLNADDINIYRQLSGGVTTAQLLHGSANAIGGQSAIIKLRWGRSEDELLFQGAPAFIKFALGENVKQSNWGERFNSRYPQTRMGVEQFYYEMFNRAKEYALKKKNSKEAVRKDLELEILCEILDGKRHITCHSYMQAEINMLLHVADSMGFKVNTFTHILEGYKVADKMKAHGANASTFADWWAYKMEVMEAIPYNAAIMQQVGVNTCVNSDDAEMARRLNHEAAKTIKYGGLSEEDAWKLCTLNPAKMLHIDDKVGSIKEGKDADLVLWSDNPLSIYARVKFTMIDGMIYYSEERDAELQAYNKSEKNRLVQKMMQAIKDGEEGVPLAKKQYFLFECESMENYDYETIEITE